MNTSQHISTQVELERLIDRYFDGETTVSEEQELKSSLASCPWNSEKIDEARFTMGYFVAHDQQKRQSFGTNRRRFMGIAASIAIILGIGGFFLMQQQRSDDMCIAYVNGKTINDDEAVMAIVRSDLNNLADVSQVMIDQLSSLGAAIELDN